MLSLAVIGRTLQSNGKAISKKKSLLDGNVKIIVEDVKHGAVVLSAFNIEPLPQNSRRMKRGLLEFWNPNYLLHKAKDFTKSIYSIKFTLYGFECNRNLFITSDNKNSRKF